MHARRKQLGRHRRRGAVIAQVAVCATLVLGMGALVLDIGAVYTTQNELLVGVVAAALAAAAELGGTAADSDPEDLALAAAAEYAALNTGAGAGGTLVVLPEDVELGRAIYNVSTGKFSFTPGGDNFDSVRVTVRRVGNKDGGNGPVTVPFLFAPILGKTSVELEARAAAVLIPRDISVVIDLSGSMSDDSELAHYRDYWGDEGEPRAGVQINLRDIWCALDGPFPSYPYIPGPEDETEYASDTGPVIGVMSEWGNPVVVQDYDPVSDPGLWYIPKNTATVNATIQGLLLARGYTADEVTCLMSGARDGTANNWCNRTAVMLGLSEWKSGRPGGRPGGDGDNCIENAEMVWAAYPSFRVNWTWANYINYVASSSTGMYYANNAFRYRFGLKTFVNFLLENRAAYSQTNILWQTPEEPLHAVRDAVRAMTDVILDLDSLDHMALEVFATTAQHEVNLTENLDAVPNRLYAMQAGHYNSTTNIAAGIITAMAELTSERSRSAAAKVIVVMSDGKPNVDENGNFYGGGSEHIDEWTRDVAQEAANQHMRLYTISVGSDSDVDLMTELATIAGGQHFHAEGTPDEYSDQLDLIFRTLGGRRPVALIE